VLTRALSRSAIGDLRHGVDNRQCETGSVEPLLVRAPDRWFLVHNQRLAAALPALSVGRRTRSCCSSTPGPRSSRSWPIAARRTSMPSVPLPIEPVLPRTLDAAIVFANAAAGERKARCERTHRTEQFGDACRRQGVALVREDAQPFNASWSRTRSKLKQRLASSAPAPVRHGSGRGPRRSGTSWSGCDEFVCAQAMPHSRGPRPLRAGRPSPWLGISTLRALI